MNLCGWVGWLIWGFIAGLIARALFPGEHRMGLLKTTLLGIGGSFAGGSLAMLLLGRSPFVFQPSGLAGAVIGSMLLLAVAEWITRRR